MCTMYGYTVLVWMQYSHVWRSFDSVHTLYHMHAFDMNVESNKTRANAVEGVSEFPWCHRPKGEERIP